MRNTKMLLSIALSAFVGLIVGWLLSQKGEGISVEKKMQIRAEFVARHEYRQDMIEQLKLRVEPLSDKLHAISERHSVLIASDSVKSLLQQSLVALIRCNQFAHEIKELDKADSLLFERYGE